MNSQDLKNLKELKESINRFENSVMDAKTQLGEKFVSLLKGLIPDIDYCIESSDDDNLWLTSEEFNSYGKDYVERLNLSGLLSGYWDIGIRCSIQVTEEIAEKIKQMGESCTSEKE